MAAIGPGERCDLSCKGALSFRQDHAVRESVFYEYFMSPEVIEYIATTA